MQEDMEVQRPGVREGAPELFAEFRVEVAEHDVRYVRVPDEARAAAQVHRGGDERLVHRQRAMSVAADAGLVAERIFERLPEADAYVLDGVMGVDVKVAVGLHGEVEQAVLGDVS